MNIPSDVIEDLLPLYQEGELSEASRQLVEEYLAENPDRAASLSVADALHVPKIDAPPDIEMKSLDRTTSLLEQKTIFGMVALALSYAEMTNQPSVLYQSWEAAVPLAGGLAMWICFLVVCRRLAGTGLEPSRSARARFIWFCGAALASTPYCRAFAWWTGWHRLAFTVLLPIMGSVGLMAGKWVGQVADTRIKK
jgi:hypothetical protein